MPSPDQAPLRAHLYVDLGHGRSCRLGVYVEGWRRARSLPPSTPVAFVPGGLGGGTVADVLAALRAGMHDRINRHLPWHGKGRRWSPDWQRAAVHAAAQVNTPRLAVHWLPPDFRRRLAHRLADVD